MKPRVLALTFGLVPLLAMFLVFAVLMGAISVNSHEGCRVAVAYRDHVPFEQKAGSWLFSLPLMWTAYDRVISITGNAVDDKRGEFVAALNAEADEGCSVDLWFMVLGDDYASWVESAARRPRLHLVYDTGGGSAWQGQRWQDLGAESFVGHPGANVAPVFFTFFLPAWLRGVPLDDAVASANETTRKLITLSGIDADGSLWRNTEAAVFGEPAARF